MNKYKGVDGTAEVDGTPLKRSVSLRGFEETKTKIFTTTSTCE